MAVKTLSECLSPLVGHDFIINLVNDDADGDGGPPPGRLKEVGKDYVVVLTKSGDEGGFANEGAEWFVPIQHITSMVHMIPECAGCVVDEAAKEIQ
ncbi:MAG: hypothetical protein V1724_09370 [Chloroflexota bacterium]